MTSTRSTVVSALALFSVLIFGVAGLSVSGNRVLDSTGKPVLLRGVDRPSLEWTAQGESLSLGDYQLMKTKWNANVVRLSLNQDFWFAGSAYQATVDQQVTWIQQVGMYVILDLHWSDPSNSGYAGQQNMADRYSINFWSQVAAKYKNNLNVLFELYNEPHDVSWSAWLNGDGGNFVGMQQLYNAVRAAGAQNIVIVNGLNWAYDLTGVGIGYALTGTNIMYATHPYNYGGKLAGDWFGGFLYLAATYPVIMTEFGQYCADDGYVQALLQQANAYGIHWTAWAWYVSGCGFPSIISDWSGTPTSPVGVVVQNFLLQGGNATAGPVGGSTTTGGGSSSTTTGGGGSPTSSPPATNGVIIYDDALQNSWQDWSWATHSLSATPARSGSSSISFNLDQYKALYFHAPSPFYPNTYNSVQFWINGGTSGGQSIYVQAYDTSSTPAPVGWQIYLPVAVAANSWAQEIILFSSFGLASNQQISGFVIVSAASSDVVYVDDISVQPVTQATSAPTTAAATAAPTTVKITAAPTTPAPTTTSIPSTARATTPAPTPTTSIPTTVKTTTSTPSTATPTTIVVTTPAPTTTAAPTTAAPTTTAALATTAKPTTTPTTKKPATTKVPTTKKPTTPAPTTLAPTTAEPTTTAPTTIVVTTSAPTTTAAPVPTTVKPTTTPTTKKPATTKAATTKKPTAAPTTTNAPTAAPTTTAAPVPTTQAPAPTTPAPVATTQAPSQGCSATVVESIQSTSTAQLTITNTGLLPIKQLLFTIVGSISGSWNIVPQASLQDTYTIPDWAINQLTPGASATQYGYNYQGLLPTVVVISVSC